MILFVRSRILQELRLLGQWRILLLGLLFRFLFFLVLLLVGALVVLLGLLFTAVLGVIRLVVAFVMGLSFTLVLMT